MNFTVKTKQNTLISIRNIYCIGRNYHAHAEELNSEVPKEPFFFQKSLPSLNTSNEFTIPKDREIHHELEVVILIRKNGEKTVEGSNFPFMDIIFYSEKNDYFVSDNKFYAAHFPKEAKIRF